MLIIVAATLMIMAAYFFLLYAGVGFIQDKRFFSTAPKENLELIPAVKERFKGAHIVGWIIGLFAVLLFLGAVFLAAWDGIRNNFIFWPFQFFPAFLSGTERCCRAAYVRI